MLIIDPNSHAAVSITDTVIANLELQRELQIIQHLQPKFSKDGNQFCYLYGENLQEGIAGFGDTPYLAMADFCRNFYSEKIQLENQNRLYR